MEKTFIMNCEDNFIMFSSLLSESQSYAHPWTSAGWLMTSLVGTRLPHLRLKASIWRYSPLSIHTCDSANLPALETDPACHKADLLRLWFFRWHLPGDRAGVSLVCLSSSWISQKLSFLSVVLRLSIVVRCLVVNTFFLILPTPYYIGWKGVPQGVKLYTESKPLKKNLKKVFEKFGSKRKM